MCVIRAVVVSTIVVKELCSESIWFKVTCVGVSLVMFKGVALSCVSV